MSNPQDSPKTPLELVSRLRVFDHSESGSVDFHLNEQECAQLIQSFIDTQKAEVTTDVQGFVNKLWTGCDEGAGVKHSEAQLCQTCGILTYMRFRENDCRTCMFKRLFAERIADRDQKLVQEAVKPWRKFVEDAKRDYDALDNVDQSVHWGHMAEAARALLSQPQEVK